MGVPSSHAVSVTSSKRKHPTEVIERCIARTYPTNPCNVKPFVEGAKPAWFVVKSSIACFAFEQRASSARMTPLSAFASALSSRNVMRLGFVGVLHAVTLHTTSVARADEMTWRLEYRRGADAPSNCPDENDLRTALSAKIGARDPFSNDAPRKITIDVSPAADRIEARIQARDEQGNIVSDSTAHAASWRCDQLATRIVFVLRDIVDPLNPSTPTSSPSSASSPPSPSSPPPVNDDRANGNHPPENPQDPIAKQPTTPTNRPKPSVSRSKPQMALSMGLGASWWNTPSTALSVAFGAAIRWPNVSVGFEGRYDYAWTLPRNKQAVANQVAGAILVCGYYAFLQTRFYGRGCLFGDLTRISIDSAKFHLTEDASLILQFEARLGAGFSLSRTWAVELHGDGTVAVPQLQFVYDTQERWQLPLFNGAFRANVVWLFEVF